MNKFEAFKKYESKHIVVWNNDYMMYCLDRGCVGCILRKIDNSGTPFCAGDTNFSKEELVELKSMYPEYFI